MEELQKMSDGDIAQRAKSSRAEALRGVREARGQAHLYEAELRRRQGVAPRHDNRALDLRPLDARVERSRWWTFW